MKKSAIKLLCCPACRGDLLIKGITKTTSEGDIVEGVLKCKACGNAYPVLDKIPRLLNHSLFSRVEKIKLSHLLTGRQLKTKIVYDKLKNISESERVALIEKLVRKKVNTADLPSKKLRERTEHDIQYRIYHTEKKEKFIKTAVPFLPKKLETIVDVGGGQGGVITCFRKHYRPKNALLIDLDMTWVEVALLRDPEIEVMRADASHIPIKTGVVDFMITTAALEHIPVWEETLREMVRTSKQGLIAYSPNGLFLYDAGHLDAPLVTVLPKNVGAVVAKLWHTLRRTKRSFDSIKNQINSMSYIPRPSAVKELRKSGASVVNVFEEFLQNSVAEDYHYSAGKLKRFLKNHPSLLKFFARTLVFFAMEPNVYLFFKSKGEKINKG